MRGVAGVVLAAGASSRMGRPKPLLELDGRTYLERVVDLLAAAGLAPMRVVLGCRAAEIGPRVPSPAQAVVCEDWSAGMLASLQAGLRSLLQESPAPAGAAVALCDMPRIDAATVRAVGEAFGRRRPPVAVPLCRGRRGHPVIFAREVWRELLDASAPTTPRDVVESHGRRVLEVEVEDPWVLRDADTPGQHRAMQAGRSPGPREG